MRFSAVTALCAAPLALAGTLQADLEVRQAVDVQVSQGSAPGVSGQGTSSNPLVIQAAGGASVTEVIIIWVNNGGNAATQTVNQPLGATGAGPAGAAQTHNVTVGGTSGLIFSPEQVKANVGDFVLFKFESNNHTVTQSAFETPCDPLAGGMDSGFMANPNNTIVPQPMMQMQVTVATPLWFFCAQNAHCGKGMTFSINPSLNKTQEQFKQLAIQQKGAGAPAVIVGGPGAAPAGTPPPAAGTGAVAPPASNNAPAVAPPAAMAPGQGPLENGACQCTCLCGPGSFPNAAVQGVGAFGGIPGGMPMGALMA